MLELSVEQIAEICDAKIIGNTDFKIKKISIDSRTVDENTLFVPIIGEKYDAHYFIDDLSEKKCKISLTQRDVISPKKDFTYLKVDNTVTALQALAKFKRKTIKVPIIAITGSVGKTTTRELISIGLSSSLRVFKTAGNNNSQIGVPLSIFAIPDDAQVIVLEAGMSEFGEMSRLADIIRPDIAVVTNIGDAHIEQLKTRENIREEKLHIQDKMQEKSAIFLNADNDLLREAKPYKGIDAYYYGIEKSSFESISEKDIAFYAENISYDNAKTKFTASSSNQKVEVELSIHGKHQVSNALAAISVASYLRLNLVDVCNKLREYKGFKHRQEIIKHKEYIIIDDTYNASPDSMKAGLGILKEQNADRKIAVLADMKELGENSKQLHEEVGEYIASLGDIQVLITLGRDSLYISEKVKLLDNKIFTKHFENREDLNVWLKKFIKSRDCILLKGSHSMKLEETVEFLLK